MTKTLLRRQKPRSYGITAAPDWPIIGFWWDATTIHAWAYDGTGAYVADVATASLPSGVEGPYSQASQRFIHDAIPGHTEGPALVWDYMEDRATGSGTLENAECVVMVWDLVANELREITATRPMGATKFVIGTPFVPPIESGHTGWLYFFAFDDADLSRGDLWRCRPDGSGTPAAITVAGSGMGIGTVDRPWEFAACDEQYAYLFGGLGSDILRYNLGGGGVEKVPNVSQQLQPSRAAVYYAGEDASYDIFIGGPFTVSGAAASNEYAQWRIRHSKSTLRWSLDQWNFGDAQTGIAWASEAPNQTGAAHVTINQGRDTSGYYPYDGADPQIGLEDVDGNTPTIAHLYTYSYPWEP